MRPSQFGAHCIVAALLLAAIPAYLTAPLAAGESEPESADPAPIPPQESPSGFRLGEPRMFIGGHAGINFPRAGSDLFDMIARELTLGKSDFRSSVVGFDFGPIFRSRYAAVFSMEYSRATAASESRDFVEEDGSAITQTTRFTQVPVTATFWFYPAKMGEKVGSYAWVPARFLPYLGGGGGRLTVDQGYVQIEPRDTGRHARPREGFIPSSGTYRSGASSQAGYGSGTTGSSSGSSAGGGAAAAPSASPGGYSSGSSGGGTAAPR